MFVKSAILLAVVQLVAAHSTFQKFVLNGVEQEQHFAVQIPANGNRPIRDVTSTSMICKDGAATDDQVEVASGSTVGMQWWRSDPDIDGASEDPNVPIAPRHLGPVLVYIAEASTAGEGAVWQKIFEDGLTNGTWGVDNFRADSGVISVDLPDLVAGDYLIRPEIIALHQASEVGEAQFFLGCGQIKVTGSGSVSLPSEGVDMTTVYSPTDPGILIDIYSEDLTEYIIPGPAVFEGTTSSFNVSSKKASVSNTTTTTGTATKAMPTTLSTASVQSATTRRATKAAATAVAMAASSKSNPSPTASAVKVVEAATTTEVDASSDSGCSSISDLPDTFTIEEFISWLSDASQGSASKVRRHGRAFTF
ncbi:glycosyl hydrolase family 61-domain-containing protein [Calycina marina]|uniref:AA9 family lytic polysaccharide monooxygenase n=1 Tax=Calycina marina TaxID=1763456 RepID=A0A9P7YV58_9HELO|nr:glycosyl hydrolase family 61-domain-containing protein [Calycina marina]